MNTVHAGIDLDFCVHVERAKETKQKCSNERRAAGRLGDTTFRGTTDTFGFVSTNIVKVSTFIQRSRDDSVLEFLRNK